MPDSLIPDSKTKTRKAPPKAPKPTKAEIEQARKRKARHKANLKAIDSGHKSIAVIMLDGSECQMKVTTRTDDYVILTAPNGETFGIDLKWERDHA